ncbi:hypothetical protein BDV98DRAFT_351539 [Pterulicium gracile]|uniref:Uncharacterized protein n=1 Tax=Pterulicium gracile TaxID=1884261 RepID=A0A5C3QPV2_9AGAR|nr:hypothetical protein BDV98DRAFT_351539 [Pterula gracilis]
MIRSDTSLAEAQDELDFEWRAQAICFQKEGTVIDSQFWSLNTPAVQQLTRLCSRIAHRPHHPQHKRPNPHLICTPRTFQIWHPHPLQHHGQYHRPDTYHDSTDLVSVLDFAIRLRGDPPPDRREYYDPFVE